MKENYSLSKIQIKEMREDNKSRFSDFDLSDVNRVKLKERVLSDEDKNKIIELEKEGELELNKANPNYDKLNEISEQIHFLKFI